MIAPGYVIMSEQFHMSYNAVNGGLGWGIFMIGVSCFFTQSMAVVWGRRPIFLLGNLLLFISSVWGYFADSYSSLLASRLIGCIGMSPFEVYVCPVPCLVLSYPVPGSDSDPGSSLRPSPISTLSIKEVCGLPPGASACPSASAAALLSPATSSKTWDGTGHMAFARSSTGCGLLSSSSSAQRPPITAMLR